VESGNDVFTGNSLANTLFGGLWRDMLIDAVGTGDDVFDGGDGNDVYLFDGDLALGTKYHHDSSGVDRIDLALTSAAIVANLGLTGNQTVVPANWC